MTHSFVSDLVFSLRKKDLSAKEITVIALTPSHMNEADSRQDRLGKI